VNLTRSMALDFGPRGIRTNCICPGTIATPVVSRLFAGAVLEAMEQSIPQHRLGKPGEVASLAVFLASDEASYINGAAITIDGGLTSWTGMPLA
jgi:meso-butanediol dehydrogenase / (S,S)-butanediol dehydrogenase / diacetyl reductase